MRTFGLNLTSLVMSVAKHYLHVHTRDYIYFKIRDKPHGKLHNDQDGWSHLLRKHELL